MSKSKDKLRDKKSTYGQAVLPLPDMMVSPMEYSYPNAHLEDYEGDGHITRPDAGLQLTEHASIPNGSTPAKIPSRDNSESFDDEGTSIEPKADTEGKERVVDDKQVSVCVRPKFYNGYAQLVQLQQPPGRITKSLVRRGGRFRPLRIYLCRWNEGIMGYQRG